MRRLIVLAALAGAACGGGSGGSGSSSGTPAAAAPTFSVTGGTKNAPISVALISTTAGAVIHYTTDGAAPTETSPTYSTALALAADTTVKAIATAAGYSPSAVATATYTFQVAAPAFSVAAGTYTSAQSVGISTTTPGATIRYTIDGLDPTNASPAYSGAIDLSTDPSTTTLKAVATRAGFASSAVASATYTIDSSATPAAQPTFSPPAPASFTTTQTVVIASATSGATIRYTTDGTDPTLAGAQTAAAPASVSLSATTTLRAVATAASFTPSPETTGTYTKTGGGGGGGDPVSFQATCNDPSTHICDTYVSGYPAGTLESEGNVCTSDGGTWSLTTPCSPAGRIATCSFTFAGMSHFLMYYPGAAVELAQQLCVAFSGTWTAY